MYIAMHLLSFSGTSCFDLVIFFNSLPIRSSIIVSSAALSTNQKKKKEKTRKSAYTHSINVFSLYVALSTGLLFGRATKNRT